MGMMLKKGRLADRLRPLFGSFRPYRALFEAHPDALFRLSTSGRLEEINPRAAELTGMTQSRIKGRSWYEWVAPEDRSLAAEHLKTALKGDSCCYHCLLLTGAGKSPVLVRVTHVPMGSKGAVKGVFCIVRTVGEGLAIERSLHQSREELRRLNREQGRVRESERRRIARDLHDQLGQTLTALKLDLAVLIEDLPPLPEPLSRRLASLLEFSDEAIEQVRGIAANLHPPMLDDLGFEATAEWFLQNWARRSHLDVRWLCDSEETGRSKGAVATTLFRILQECMTNVGRHARASKVSVHYREGPENAVLSVEDNGVGFDAGNPLSPGIGLVGMQERVAMLDGDLSIDSRLGRGTRVTVTLPLEAGAND
ncbi:MAG: histidine kinase [Oleiphilaceae bacterium]|nr:histidine kinase [Oleiphilaceae bacterium]